MYSPTIHFGLVTAILRVKRSTQELGSSAPFTSAPRSHGRQADFSASGRDSLRHPSCVPFSAPTTTPRSSREATFAHSSERSAGSHTPALKEQLLYAYASHVRQPYFRIDRASLPQVPIGAAWLPCTTVSWPSSSLRRRQSLPPTCA